MIGLLVGGGGCLMAGNYHSAKTLGKGESDFGLTFSATRYNKTVDDGMGGTVTESVVWPTVIPEITYHVGMTDDLEVGGRVALGSLGLEADVKYRFLQNDKLHLAIAPAVSYQAFIVLQGVGFRLPGILTYELADNADFTAALFGSVTNFSTPGDTGIDEFDTFNGTLLSTGGAVGFDLHGETFSFRPSVEFARYVADLSSGDNSTSEDFNTVNFMVHLSWTFGKEKKQLDRIERKLDQLTAPPPPGGWGPPPGPPPPPPPPMGPPPPPPM